MAGLSSAASAKILEAIPTLQASVTSRLGGIISIQRGTITFNNTSTSTTSATISSVTTSRATLRNLGSNYVLLASPTVWPFGGAPVQLVNATTVTTTHQSANGDEVVNQGFVSFEVTEYGA